jgi:hypothetical protein
MNQMNRTEELEKTKKYPGVLQREEMPFVRVCLYENAEMI